MRRCADSASARRWRIDGQEAVDRFCCVWPCRPERDQDLPRIEPGRLSFVVGCGDKQRRVRRDRRRRPHPHQPEFRQASCRDAYARIVQTCLCKCAATDIGIMSMALERRGHLVENQKQQQSPAQCQATHIEASGKRHPSARGSRRTHETMGSGCTHGRQCTRRKSARRVQTGGT